MRKASFFIVIFMAFVFFDSWGMSGDMEIIDSPTAYCLDKNIYQIGSYSYYNESLLISFDAVIFENFAMGVSYGGAHIIGREKSEWNDRPELHLKYVVLNNEEWPNVAVGFNSQGIGLYNKSASRYDIKSKGLYLTVSDYLFSEKLLLNVGVNYTLEDNSKKKISLFTGTKVNISHNVYLVSDFDFATNDDNVDTGGLWNIGMRWEFDENLALEFFVKDLLNRDNINRAIKITYKNIF